MNAAQWLTIVASIILIAIAVTPSCDQKREHVPIGTVTYMPDSLPPITDTGIVFQTVLASDHIYSLRELARYTENREYFFPNPNGRWINEEKERALQLYWFNFNNVDKLYHRRDTIFIEGGTSTFCVNDLVFIIK